MTTTPTTAATTPTTTAKSPWLSANHANHATNPHGRRAHAHGYICAQARARALQPSRGSRGLSGLNGLWRGCWRGLEFSRVVLLTGGEKWTKSTALKSASNWTVTAQSALLASRWIPACRVTATSAANGAAASSVERVRHAATSTTCRDLPAMRLGLHRNGERGRGNGAAWVQELQGRLHAYGARAVRQRIDTVPVAGTVQGEGVGASVNFTQSAALGYHAPAAPHGQSGLAARRLRRTGRQQAAIFMFVSIAPSLGGGVGGRKPCRSLGPGLLTRIAALPRLAAREGGLSTDPRRLAMSKALELDRNTASALNPFIGIDTAETLHHCERVVSDLGYVVSVSECAGLQNNWPDLFRVFETITFAMRYEAHQLSKQKEASHV